MELHKIWGKAQKDIKEKIGSTTYETWFSSLQVKQKDPRTLIIETPDDFFKNWIIDHYLPIINESLKNISSEIIDTLITVNPNFIQTQNPPSESPQNLHPQKKRYQNNINPRFTFENFVTGSSNRFAYAACLAVAENPAKAYNPLFIYGGVGLGKTHLMQSIANKIHRNQPYVHHCYISSEQFTNELINAIRNRSTPQFRQKYRNIDVLLIDDIHFIAGKEATQEEFFHTFNTLHDNRKQIIISSDKPPKEISKIEERLSSRFAWGLITDIQAPDFETRVAILRKKIEHEPMKVPDDVIFFIAQEIKKNIRELEGALIRVIAYSLLEEKIISLDMAKVILKDMIQKTVKMINTDIIQKRVAEFFQISSFDLKSKRRHRNLVFPRQIAMYLSRKLTNLSLPEIGHFFGGKDHTTVIHSCKKIEHELEHNNELKNTIEKITILVQQ